MTPTLVVASFKNRIFSGGHNWTHSVSEHFRNATAIRIHTNPQSHDCQLIDQRLPLRSTIVAKSPPKRAGIPAAELAAAILAIVRNRESVSHNARTVRCRYHALSGSSDGLLDASRPS